MTTLVFGITGASGNLGRIATAELHKAGTSRLVLGTRNPDALLQHTTQKVDVRQIDFDMPETLESGFEGIDRLLIVSTDNLSLDGARQQQQQRALTAAKAAGVKYIAYTSMPNPSAGSPITFAPDHVAMEADLATSGLEYGALRISWYFENLLPLLPHVIESGTWYSSSGDGRISYVARNDAARAAARALHKGARGVIDLTGPNFFTTPEMAQILSDVTGRPVRVVQLSADELSQKLSSLGLPDWYVATLVMTDANQREGRFTDVSDSVSELTGGNPVSWNDFLQENIGRLLSRITS